MKTEGARWLSASSKGAFGVVVLLLVALAYFTEPWSQTAPPVRASVPELQRALLLNVEDRVTSNQPALVYRNSVIPGGVHDSLELTSALARDRLAKVHYANFDAAKAHIVHVKAPRFVHVSYRMGDEIYWTKKKLQLKTGETLLTDGQSFVRTRCGNRIADTPQPKVSDREPPPEVFDTVIPQPPAASPKAKDGAGSHAAPPNGPPIGTEGSIPRPPAWPPHQDLPPVPPIVPDHNPPLPSFPPTPVIELPDDVPRQIPEPGSLALVMVTLFSLFLIRRRNRKK